jgi:3,4-dihydroxy 2-butanone 4-phosphate synthase/GTP cyclohydrolase II
MGELTVTQMARARIPTAEGEFQLCLYVGGQDGKEHLALVYGDIAERRGVLVRVHSECFTGDVLGSLRCDCGAQLDEAMKLIAKEGAGVIIYLRQEGRGIGLLNKLRAYNLQDQGYDTVDANLVLGHGADERDYTTAALILKHLGVHSVRLLTNNPLKTESLQASGINVITRVPVEPHVTAENAAYLFTKVRRMRHLLEIDSFSALLESRGNGIRAKNKSPSNSPEHSPADYEVGIKELGGRVAGHRLGGRPFITLSYAQSLDGCIAAHPGRPLALSGRESLVLTHRLRAEHDAILVGIGTVLADNPRLTVRLVEGRSPQPVVADSRLRFPPEANLLRHPLPPLIATSEHADRGRQKALEMAGARILRVPADAQGRVILPALLERLAELQIRSLMVEGGARIITSFLRERMVDHLVLTVAPRFVGGFRGVLQLGEADSVCRPRLHNLRHQRLGEDLIFWGDPVWEDE